VKKEEVKNDKNQNEAVALYFDLLQRKWTKIGDTIRMSHG